MTRFAYISLFAALLLPGSLAAQISFTSTTTGSSVPTSRGFTRDGVLGCNAAQYGGSPGTTAAIGSTYVPVSDAGVTLNTGVLVYKACVLDGIANRLRESATAEIDRAAIKSYLNARVGYDARGNLVQLPLHPVDLSKDRLEERDRVTAFMLQNGALSKVNPAMRAEIERSVARAYYQSTRKSADALLCPYDDLENALLGKPKSVRDALYHLQNPACTPLGAYQIARGQVASAGDAAVSDMVADLDRNGGVYSVTTIDANGRRITQTPGRFVASSMEQILQSGYRQQENATGIDGMVNALFAGISTEIFRSGQGLAGLVRPIGNQPSYLDQVTAAASEGLRTAVNNAAIAILRDAQLVEKAYGDIMRSILEQMVMTQANFQTAERACWTNIIARACVPGTLKSDGTCTSTAGACTTEADGTQTCPSGAPLKVATSTIYSQVAVSGSSIFGLQQTAAQNVQVSDNALKLFVTLIETVKGTVSQGAQLQAQLQLEQLISQGLIHKQSDLDQATAAKKSIDAAIGPSGTYVNEIKALWSGDASDGTLGVVSWNGTYPPKAGADLVGWCNYGNATTIQRWIAKWTK